jgi:RNA polymerase sigma factor (sigma-70 family)
MWLVRNPELLVRFRRGDRDAMDEVYRYYAPGVSAFLHKGFSFRSGESFFFFRGFSDEAELESCVQEVFRRAFEEKARLSYNGVTSFSNWVLAIARNMVINQFRNKEIAFSQFTQQQEDDANLSPLDRELPEEYSGVLYATPAEPQDEKLEREELRTLLDRFLTDLTDHDRNLLLMRFSEGKGQEETASLLGSTRMKVRTAESKLKSRLRAYLRHSGYIKEEK